MKKLLLLFSAFLLFLQPVNVLAQGLTCSTANVFCTGTNYTFPNTVNSPSLGNNGPFGCLGTTPNPVWYYMQISQGGNIEITLNQTDLQGFGIDVDFVLWGPFNSLAEACANYQAGNIVDCSFSAAPTEIINVNGAFPGQVFLLLMTNFSGAQGTMSFQKTGGNAETGGVGQLSITSTLPACQGGTVMLTASGGVPGNYTWTGPDYQPIITDTLIITDLQPANSGTYIVTSGNGICTNMAAVNVSAAQAPLASSNGLICPGGTINLSAGNGYTSYSWVGPNGFTSSLQNPVIANADTSHAGLYTVYGLLNNCVSLPGTVQVNITNSLSVSAYNNGPIYQGGTLLLTAAGTGSSFSWTGPNGFAQTGVNPYIQNVALADSGIYSVTVASAGCASVSAQTQVTIIPMNQISGTVYDDANNNSVQDFGEASLAGKVVIFQPGNYVAVTNSQGMYNAFVPDNNYTVSIGGLFPYQTSNPAAHTVPATGSSQVVTGKDFGLYSPVVNDLQISIAEVWTAAPGFPTYHKITCHNVGSTTMSGTIKYIPNAALVLTPNVSPGFTVSGDTLIWSFSNLQPNQIVFKDVHLTTPVGTALGTILNSTAWVTPFTGDFDTLNNVFALSQTVTGSWDPNDKAVQPAGHLTPQQIASGQDLVYTIRFQNTGTAPAVNIMIADSLSSNLDLSTFRMLSASHDYELSMHGNGITEWRFANIMLPDSNSNEMESHGYVQYTIQPKQTLLLGDNITNTAHIYFDFNEAVVTNTTFTPVGVVASEEQLVNAALSIHPNPSSGKFTIKLNNAGQGLADVSVINMLGQTVFEENGISLSGNSDHQVQLQKGMSGIYLLQVKQGGNTFTKRIVLQN